MAIAPLTSQLPSLVGSLPDLFRRPDAAAARTTDGRPAEPRAEASVTADAATDDSPHACSPAPPMRPPGCWRDAPHSAPLTYGRRALPADAPAAAPVGIARGHLDVRADPP